MELGKVCPNVRIGSAKQSLFTPDVHNSRYLGADLNDQPSVKRAILIRVSLGIRNDPRAPDYVVAAVVRMAVNPKRRCAVLDHVAQVG